jgi:hypothetical protein
VKLGFEAQLARPGFLEEMLAGMDDAVAGGGGLGGAGDGEVGGPPRRPDRPSGPSEFSLVGALTGASEFSRCFTIGNGYLVTIFYSFRKYKYRRSGPPGEP